MAPHNDIIFFHYEFSPYARRVICYLQLRGIDYAECIQPVYLPREDLNALGVKYRRIPLMSIGRDIYCDTRLILQKLEERFPKGALGAAQSDQKAIEKLLEIWTIDGGIFARAAQSIPLKMPLMSDPKFLKDREDYTGTSWSQGDIADVRPEAITHLRDGFAFLENGLLADGREWILRTEKPTLADIEGQDILILRPKRRETDNVYTQLFGHSTGSSPCQTPSHQPSSLEKHFPESLPGSTALTELSGHPKAPLQSQKRCKALAPSNTSRRQTLLSQMGPSMKMIP